MHTKYKTTAKRQRKSVKQKTAKKKKNSLTWHRAARRLRRLHKMCSKNGVWGLQAVGGGRMWRVYSCTRNALQACSGPLLLNWKEIVQKTLEPSSSHRSDDDDDDHHQQHHQQPTAHHLRRRRRRQVFVKVCLWLVYRNSVANQMTCAKCDSAQAIMQQKLATQFCSTLNPLWILLIKARLKSKTETKTTAADEYRVSSCR